MDWYLTLYLLGGAIIGVTELVALFNKPEGDTLSEHVWRWVGVGRRWTLVFTLRRLLILVFLGWLIPHFLFGWFAPTHVFSGPR